MLKAVVIFVLKVYKKLISPVLETIFGKACKFEPTCSVYAICAIEDFGVIKGGCLALKRFLRCNPLSSGQFDPLPPKLN